MQSNKAHGSYVNILVWEKEQIHAAAISNTVSGQGLINICLGLEQCLDNLKEGILSNIQTKLFMTATKISTESVAKF